MPPRKAEDPKDRTNGCLKTRDGWICLGATSDAEIRGLERILDIEILADERFHDVASRDANCFELKAVIGAAVEARKMAGSSRTWAPPA